MADINAMEQVFNDTLEKYGSSNRRLINTWTGNMGRQIEHERKILRQDIDALKKRFEEAKNA